MENKTQPVARPVFTGIVTDPGREQKYTVWYKGYVVLFTDNYDRAKKALSIRGALTDSVDHT